MVTLGGISPKVVAKCYKMIFGVQFFKKILILQSVKFIMPWPQLNLYTPTNHCYAFNWRFSVPCLRNLNSLCWTPHYNCYRLQHMQYHPGVGWARIWKSMDDIYQAICCTFSWRLPWWAGWLYHICHGEHGMDKANNYFASINFNIFLHDLVAIKLEQLKTEFEHLLWVWYL